jgi:hypothetical protein
MALDPNREIHPGNSRMAPGPWIYRLGNTAVFISGFLWGLIIKTGVYGFMEKIAARIINIIYFMNGC